MHVCVMCCVLYFIPIADLLHRLVSLEAEHQPLPGYEPAVNDVIAYLNKVKGA